MRQEDSAGGGSPSTTKIRRAVCGLSWNESFYCLSMERSTVSAKEKSRSGAAQRTASEPDQKELQHGMRNAAAAADACCSMSKLFVQVLAQSLCLIIRMTCQRSETAANRLPTSPWRRPSCICFIWRPINRQTATLVKQKRSRRKSEISLTCWAVSYTHLTLPTNSRV